MTQPAPPNAPPSEALLEDEQDDDPEVLERVSGPLPHMAFAFAGGCVAVAALIVVTAIGAVASLPTLREAQNRALERKAIASLRAIAVAQRRFREEDRDRNGKHDYGTLSQLAMAGLLDPDLASGLKDGYLFEAGVGLLSPEEEWMAVANPVASYMGDRCFVLNHEGSIHYQQWGQRLSLELERCTIPGGTQRLLRSEEADR
ncbi:MAG: hypothetical protein AB7N76_30830 [Planctomycetota bacterium]